MRTGLKKGLVLGMSACMALTSLAGCGKKEGLDASAAVATLDGEKVSAGVVNFMLRYEQAQFDSSYGSWLKSYYGDVWNSDLTGSGETYGETFKDQIMNTMERLLLAEKHMEDYQVELTDEDKAAITQAASEFIASNDEEVLEKMSATQENVERVLTLRTIQTKMETEMCADVDTEVSDEEAAQRTVSYVRFALETETEASADDEAETADAGTEAESGEAETAAPDTEAETGEAETAAEETEAAGTEAAVTEAAASKTGSADTEAPEETETASGETETEAAGTEAESAAEADTETAGEEETETETEDAATIEAKAKAKAKAEAFLEQVKDEEDFAAAAEKIADADDNVSTSSFTFGDDDTYPDETIISVTKGLEDNTLVEEVVEVGDSYYVLYVDDAFDEEATADKKEEIVNTRKQDAINALYEEWMEGAEFTVDEKVYGQMVFDLELMIETETSAETEAGSEAVTEEGTEAETEAGSEAVTEEGAETVTEAGSEAETEAATEA